MLKLVALRVTIPVEYYAFLFAGNTVGSNIQHATICLTNIQQYIQYERFKLNLS